ncbi:high mobility group B protein 6 isoform X2 [Elaeis guineensis]|uniref:High mobility group B protein 6 isoform X2 n=1 Tax=Elaeis guineensis var. tenera TaxID=51953 RepID=A0A6I9QV58_ELAGV|nr:high mobility group B protein 6 isoform X2 [Elaeis guineensis]
MAETKKGRGRKALKTLTENDVNISAGKVSSSPLPPFAEAEDSQDSLVSTLSPQKAKKMVSRSKARATTKKDFADELQELQGRFEQLQLEKEKTEVLLMQRDEMLKLQEEELENRGKEQERLQKELKKLQKLKEFKPTMSIPFIMSLREKEQEKKENKKKKKKKDKDCLEKKKPCPAYVLWCKDQWNEVKKENPDADFKEISNTLGAKWKTLSAEEKKPYEEKYQREKEAYLQIVGQEKRENEAIKLLEEEQLQKTAMELLEQYMQFKQEVDKEGKKMRKQKDPLKPKHPMSAFLLFSQERRAALLEQNKNVLEIAKIAGEEWKNMTEGQRAPYEEISKKCKEEYNQQMELYKQNKLEEAATLEKEEEELKKILKQEALQLLKKKEKTENIIKKTREARQKKKKKEEQNADPNKPRRPPSSFLLFSMEARKQLLEERPGIGNSTLSALISVKWKELCEAEKQVWNDKAAEGMATYKREMEEYNKSIAMGKIDTPDHES